MSARTARAAAVACLLATASPASAQWTGAASAVVGRMEHRVDVGFGPAASVGTVVGVAAHARGWKLLQLDAHAISGRLAADAVARDDRTMGELALRAGVMPLSWLTVGATATVRGYDATPAEQRWTLVGVDAEARLEFAGGGVRTLLGGALLPRVTVSGRPDADLGIGTRAGLEVERGWFIAGVDYRLERYLFPDDPLGATRREQLSGLLLRIGRRW